MLEDTKKAIASLRNDAEVAFPPMNIMLRAAANLIEINARKADELNAQLEAVKAERDRYWDWIKAMGCETCSGDCVKCDGQSGWVWSGEVKEDQSCH